MNSSSWVGRKRETVSETEFAKQGSSGWTPSKADGLAWTTNLSCWVSSKEQRTGIPCLFRGRLHSQEKGLHTCLVLRSRGSRPGSAPPSPCASVKLLGPSFSLLWSGLFITVPLHSRSILRLNSDRMLDNSLGRNVNKILFIKKITVDPGKLKTPKNYSDPQPPDSSKK